MVVVPDFCSDSEGLDHTTMRARDSPYISCSSIGSTISSSSEFSSSEDVEGVNGSGEYALAGTVLENRPRVCCFDE